MFNIIKAKFFLYIFYLFKYFFNLKIRKKNYNDFLKFVIFSLYLAKVTTSCFSLVLKYFNSKFCKSPRRLYILFLSKFLFLLSAPNKFISFFLWNLGLLFFSSSEIYESSEFMISLILLASFSLTEFSLCLIR